MATIAKSGSGQNHEPGISSKSSTWVARTQAFGPSIVAFPGTLAERAVEQPGLKPTLC